MFTYFYKSNIFGFLTIINKRKYAITIRICPISFNNQRYSFSSFKQEVLYSSCNHYRTVQGIFVRSVHACCLSHQSGHVQQIYCYGKSQRILFICYSSSFIDICYVQVAGADVSMSKHHWLV